MPKKSQLSFFTQLFNHLLTGLLVCDSQFSIIYNNATVEQTLFASSSQIQSSQIFQILTDKSLPVAEHETYQAHLRAQFFHTSKLYQAFIRHSCTILGINTAVLVDYGVSPMEIDQQIFYVIEIWTKDRQSQIHQEQQQHEQHHVTRQLIRSMAHEVKNPLAGIYGASQLLQKNITQFSQHHQNEALVNKEKLIKVENYLDIILGETQRLNELVNQLLGSPTLPNWQNINIHEPIEHVLSLVALNTPQINFVRDYDLSLPEIVADKNQLIQVFLNLINNAVQALTEKLIEHPQITLRTRIEYQHTIGDTRHKSVLKIDVIDNGEGIEAKFISQIFYPLVTGRANGTGLGLALVHDIIARHQGMITVHSEQGKTDFQIYLPWQQSHSKSES